MEGTFITVAGVVVITLLAVALLVLAVNLTQTWVRRAGPVRNAGYYRSATLSDWGELKPASGYESPNLVTAVQVLREARMGLQRTLVDHRRRGVFPTLLDEQNLPIYPRDNTTYMYRLTEAVHDADAHRAKVVKLTPACTWTVRVGTSRMGRPREETIFLTVDRDKQPVLHTSASTRTYPGTPIGWTTMVADWHSVGGATQREHDP